MISKKMAAMRLQLEKLGVPHGKIKDYSSMASEEIRREIISLVERAVSESRSAEAEGLSADEFLRRSELDIKSGYMHLSSSNENTHDGTVPYPILPWGDSRAEISDNNYQAVSEKISDKKTDTAIPDSNIVKSSTVSKIDGPKKLSEMAADVATALNKNTSTTIKKKPSISSSESLNARYGGQSNDSSYSRVAYKKDITAAMMEINATIRSDIDSATDSIISKYISTAMAEFGR